MNKALLVACLILTPVPAFSQSASDSDMNPKGDRLERLLRELGTRPPVTQLVVDKPGFRLELRGVSGARS